MEHVNHFAPAIQAIGAVAIVILTAALVCLTKRYIEVSEALQKPCITVASEPRDPMRAVMAAPFVAQVKQAPNVEILNVGTGPALDVNYRLLQIGPPEGSNALNVPGFVNHLQSGQAWATHLARNSLTGRIFQFIATYQGLSGKKYETSIRVEDEIIKSFKFRRGR
jgi:hypothetical protein